MHITYDLPVTLDDIQTAKKRLAGKIYKTGMPRSNYLSERCKGEIFLKFENMQRTGSFKIRGAFNKLSALTEAERRKGVVACSAGNHAQGVSLSCAMLGIDGKVVVPKGAPKSKVAATQDYSAEVILHGDNFNDTIAKVSEIVETEGRIFIPPYDDALVIAGQGTIGLEILDQLPDLDAVLPLSFLTKMAVGKVLLQSLALELEKVLAQWSLMALTLQLSFLPGSELQLFPQPSFLPGYPWYLWMYSYFLFHPDDNKAPDPLWKCSGKSPLPLQVADSRSHGNHWSYRSARQRMNAIWHHAYQYFH